MGIHNDPGYLVLLAVREPSQLESTARSSVSNLANRLLVTVIGWSGTVRSGGIAKTGLHDEVVNGAESTNAFLETEYRGNDEKTKERL